MSNETYIEEWEPKYPKLKALADLLRKPSGKWSSKADNVIYDALTSGKANLLEKIAYGDPLIKGNKWQMKLDPDVLEALDFVPGGGTAKMATIGPVGARMLGDKGIWRKMIELSSTLRKTNPKDWKLQKEIIESTPGMYPIPRGRDIDPSLPHVKFGYEMPEGSLTPDVWESELFQGTRPSDFWTASIGEVVDHPRLFQAYPKLKEFDFLYVPDMGLDNASFHAKDKIIKFGPHSSEKSLNRNLNHELGHYAQSVEGWPEGTNTVESLRQLSRVPQLFPPDYLPKELKRQFSLAKSLRYKGLPGQDAAYMMYRREAGEQLAEALARSAEEGGGKVTKHFTVDPKIMYDRRVLDTELDNFWRQHLQKEMEATMPPLP